MATVLDPKFSLVFDIATNHLTFTDTSDSWTSLCEGIPRITHEDSDTVIYDGTGWHSTTPTWSDPPITDAGKTITSIDLPTVPAGTYKVEYWTRTASGATPVLTTRRYTLSYESPEVTINPTILCSTSQLTSVIVNDFDMDFDGVTVHPTATPSHKIVKPEGSNYSGTLGTTSDWSRTIGGGATDETRLWTRVWQIVASVSLSYAVCSWSDTTPTVYITDTVTGNDEANVQCDTTVCALATCFAQLLARWRAARTSNIIYYQDKTPVVNEATALFAQLLWYERCGVSTESTVLALQTVLAGENCNCTTTSDTASHPVTPWGVVSGTVGSASTFVFWTESGAPTESDGNDGDIWLDTDTSELYRKSGGAWALKDDLTGADGTPGSATGDKIKVIVSDITRYHTPASTVPTAVSYTMAVGNAYFDWEGDAMEFMFLVRLGLNDSGKTLNLYYGGDNMLEWFTDDLVTENNCTVIVRMRIVRETNISQHVTCWIEREGAICAMKYYRSYSMDLTSTKNVVLYGTNSAATTGDITGYETEVIVKKRETDLIPGGSASGSTVYSQVFVATEGQTEFVVTDFTVTPYNNIHLNDVMQGPAFATVSGQTFTTAALSEGDRLLIVTGFGYQTPNA